MLLRFGPFLDCSSPRWRAFPPPSISSPHSSSFTSHLLTTCSSFQHQSLIANPMLQIPQLTHSMISLLLFFYFGYLSILWKQLSSNLAKHYRKSHLTKIPGIILDSLPINSNKSFFPFLIADPIITFKLLQGFFCATFNVPFDFPFHCYLTKCSQIFFKKFAIFFMFSFLFSLGVSQLPFFYYPYPVLPLTHLYSIILLISVLSPYLLKFYYYSVLCRFLKIRTLDDLIESLVANGVNCAEEKSWGHEKIARFRSEIGMLLYCHFFPHLSYRFSSNSSRVIPPDTS